MSIPTPLDAQFNRAVDMVQSLPKGGPLQTSYDEQLHLYSLYKQATEGDNTKSRPGVLDMINRKKWDAWAKQKGVDKDEAKKLYVAALLKIFKRFEGQNELARDLARELEAHGLARAPSPASSTSSYHSSQASLPSPPAGAHMAPPDPFAPAPDVAPHFIPPSALTASHRSLVSLAQQSQSHSHAPSHHTHSLSHPPEHAHAYAHAPAHSPSTRHLEPAHDGYPAGASSAGRASRPQSTAGSRLGVGAAGRAAGPSNGVLGADPRFSTHSLPLPPRHPLAHPPAPAHAQTHAHAHAHSALGLVPDPALSALSPALAYTPETRASPQPHLGIFHPVPAYARAPSASTYSHAPAAPPDVPAALERIQTSLAALHERLSTLERTHALGLRRDARARRRAAWPWSSAGADDDEDALDRAEEDEERARWPAPNAPATTRVRVRRKSLGLRLVWILLAAVRRAAVDLGIGVVVAVVAAVVLGGGWRRARGTVSRINAGVRQLVSSP
ncbi:hypothetical protein Q5752_002401 [Cryptotrichosporon argae]